MEAYMRLDIEEFLRICDCLIQYMTDEEVDEIECIMVFLRRKKVRLYDLDLDDLSASLAFSKLPAIDGPAN